MMGSRTATPLAKRDLPALAALLAMEGLPNQDIAEAGRRFWRVDAPDGLLGYGGLEIYGPDGLLRSVVLPPERRRKGEGCTVVDAISKEAVALGLERLWLLTIGAAGFFERIGFTRAERGDAPPAIRASAQFAGLCPGSAVCLRRDLASTTAGMDGRRKL
ncbi:amino-acid N-acetyltransferase [Azospirillum brasilense]|uniref:GCN5-related N-acetyltransferase n=1 Tax=Azospirillum baldaniorum TaxID=1064539 RepID=A0A9P1JS29_9PROT|nr:arsenic resistance N-acetyltransferase ArsN2 [Azospirillum baldaniorum]TWA81016.1 amino-acid N-acetyltransferase [Azospirillum brasilense]CCC98709.1 GCN5-related N-acetyltransferase [Azospirillum baldaniorum]